MNSKLFSTKTKQEKERENSENGVKGEEERPEHRPGLKSYLKKLEVKKDSPPRVSRKTDPKVKRLIRKIYEEDPEFPETQQPRDDTSLSAESFSPDRLIEDQMQPGVVIEDPRLAEIA